MTTFTDNSNMEVIINTLKWGDVMLAALAEKTDNPVVLSRCYVRDDEIVFAITYRKKKYSVTIPFTHNFREFEILVRSAKISQVELVTNFHSLIVGKTLDGNPLFN